MSYDLNKWVANERLRVRRRRHLPILLGFMMLLAAAIPIFEVLDKGGDTHALANFSPFLLMVAVALTASPFSRDFWSGPGGKADYDEFESAALSRATARAFKVIVILILLTFGWFWLAAQNDWPIPRSPMDWSAFGLAFVTIATILPIFFVELMVPLPPESDADEEEEIV